MAKAKIRHIAIRSEDVDATAALLHEVFDLDVVRKRGTGAIDLSDGDLNITLLPMDVGGNGRQVRPGFEHIGFTVDDEAEFRRRLEAHGAEELPSVQMGEAYYEAKYLAPEGLILDIGHWAGTSPIGEREPDEVAAPA